MGRGFLALQSELGKQHFPVPWAGGCEACDICHHEGRQTEDEANIVRGEKRKAFVRGQTRAGISLS